MSTAAEVSEVSGGTAWSAMTLEAAEALLCADDAPFAMETVTIHGVPTRVWKNALPNLAELARAGRAHGDRTFLVYEDERVTFDGWFRAVAALAHHLRSLGVGKGDRVALAMRNLPEWPVAFFAIAATGAICVPLNAWWTGQELAYGLSDPGVKVLLGQLAHDNPGLCLVTTRTPLSDLGPASPAVRALRLKRLPLMAR